MSSWPPGWYDAPGLPGRRQWWDGYQWTTHTETALPPEAIGPSKSLMTWMWVTALLMPAIGFILGIVVMAKGKGAEGFAAIATSLLAFVFWSAVIGALQGTPV